MYRHYIFDIDGTLLDTEQTGMLSLRQAVKEFTGKELTMEQLLPFFGLPSSKAAQILNLDEPERFAQVWEMHFQELMYLVKPFPGVETLLARLKADGCKLGIVTSRSSVEIDYDPNLKKLAHAFDCIVCSDDTPRPKPFPDPVLAYLEKMGAKPEECLYLGDTEHDFSCANSAGVDFALADWKHRGEQGIPARYFFSSVESLMEQLNLTI